MKKLNTIYIVALMTAIFLVGCGGGTSSDSTSGTTSSSEITSPSGTTVQCREIAPTLQSLTKIYASSKDDYIAYKDSKGSSDNAKGSGDSGGSHNEGRDCLACHSFASAGTVFTSLNAADNTPGAAGYRIKLSTGIVYASARGTGNSRTSSFPSSNFTAQVIDPNGNIVNSSANMSHDASRRACNSCHSSSGNSGAPGRITSAKLSSSTPTPVGSIASICVSFNKNVLPILQTKCKNCHGSNGNFTITTANATFANISALKGNAQVGGTYLLDKGSNTLGHGGGNIIPTSSAEYTTIKAWITEGALNN